MKKRAFVSVLAPRFSDFVRFRRLGAAGGDSQIPLLRYFDRFLDENQFAGPWPTRDVVQRYLESTAHLSPGSRCNRLSVIRQFCGYLRLFEAQCYVPPGNLLRDRRPRRLPHLYTQNEMKALLSAARQLGPPGSLRHMTYYTLFGVLYTTGLRCGEAIGLDLGDVELDKRVLCIRSGKFGKSRWVPMSCSTSLTLQRYIEQRARAAPNAPDQPVFVNLRAHRLHQQNIDQTFRHLLSQCGLRGGKGSPGPRIHDLRHAFACTRLLAWYREGKDVNALLPVLSTYLGHVKVTSTQVYLRATVELLEHANERFLQNFRLNVLQRGE